MNRFIRKASDNIITTYLKDNQISINNSILKQYIQQGHTPLDGLINFTPEGSYVKWKINIIDNGIGQALIDISVLELVIQGKIDYEIEGGKYDLGDTIGIDVNIPISKDAIKVDYNITNNMLEISYIDYRSKNEIMVEISSSNEY